jgi:peptidoglycan/xylan/chitin deacetylase (PgdA/CDA1 family)
MRPPYGDATEKNAAFLNSLGYTVVTWSIDIKDWEKSTSVKDEENTVASALQNSGENNIILQHDVSLTNEEMPLVLIYFWWWWWCVNRSTIKQQQSLPPSSLPM